MEYFFTDKKKKKSEAIDAKNKLTNICQRETIYIFFNYLKS